jgi:hypothetical protein
MTSSSSPPFFLLQRPVMVITTFILCSVVVATHLSETANAWVPTTPTSRSTQSHSQRHHNLHQFIDLPQRNGQQTCWRIGGGRLGRKSSSVFSLESTADASSLLISDDNENDDEEWEEVELDILTEAEFYGSEWLVGSVMDSNPNKIEETWVRLATDTDGKNVAIWGDKSQGTWSFDVSNQFISFSKQNFFGKAIWAGVVDDYYYTLGTIRGYNMWSAAAVLGQWQAKRLGVGEGEAGIAPWFQQQEDDGSDGDDDEALSMSSTSDDSVATSPKSSSSTVVSSETQEEATSDANII